MTQAPETDAGAPVLPTVQLVVIENSRLVYRERPGAKTVTVVLDRLEARSKGRQSPLRLSLNGAFNGQPFSIEGELGALAGLSVPVRGRWISRPCLAAPRLLLKEPSPNPWSAMA